MSICLKRGKLLCASFVLIFVSAISVVGMVKGKRSAIPRDFPVALLEWDWDWHEGDYLTAEGKIQNNGNAPVKYVVVTVRFFKQPVGTSAQELVCRCDTFLEEWDELSPGEMSPFYVRTYSHKAGNVTHAEVSLSVHDPSKPEGELALISVQLQQLRRIMQNPQ